MSDQPEQSPNGPDSEDEPTPLTADDILAAGDEADALTAAREEVDQLNDKVLRLAAELENTRRRADREKTDAGRYAIANFARDLIGVADNFERALRIADESPANEGSGDVVSGLIDGLRMTEKELLGVLARHQIKRVFPERDKFDPNLHQAVAQVPHPDIPTGHVVDVAQPGFTIGERVLRAAMVTVSSGPGPEGGSGGDAPGARLDTKV